MGHVRTVMIKALRDRTIRKTASKTPPLHHHPSETGHQFPGANSPCQSLDHQRRLRPASWSVSVKRRENNMAARRVPYSAFVRLAYGTVSLRSLVKYLTYKFGTHFEISSAIAMGVICCCVHCCGRIWYLYSSNADPGANRSDESNVVMYWVACQKNRHGGKMPCNRGKEQQPGRYLRSSATSNTKRTR